MRPPAAHAIASAVTDGILGKLLPSVVMASDVRDHQRWRCRTMAASTEDAPARCGALGSLLLAPARIPCSIVGRWSDVMRVDDLAVASAPRGERGG